MTYFHFPGIERQFIGNENGAIYEFNSDGDIINWLRYAYDGTSGIIKNRGKRGRLY